MNILIVCTKFSEDAANGWLTNELAASLAARGHTVDVIHHAWTDEGEARLATMYGNVTVLTCPALGAVPRWLPKVIRKLGQWVWSSRHTARVAQRLLPARDYDLLIGFSPAVASDGIVKAYRDRAKHACLVYWDFFPTSAQQVQILPGGRLVEPLAHALETHAVARFDRAGCMSPANIDFFRQYFPAYRGEVFHLPVWGPGIAIEVAKDRATLRQEFNIGVDEVVCVFGGQLVPGRNVEAMCDLADRAQIVAPRVRFLIAGSGSLASMVAARAQASTNLRYLGQLTREQYAELLTASDIGLVFTSMHSRVPTFPSKTVDYFRAGVPILGAVEDFGDYSAIITHEIGAGLSCAARDIATLDANLQRLALDRDLRRACGQRGKAHYFAHMTSAHIAEKLTEPLPS